MSADALVLRATELVYSRDPREHRQGAALLERLPGRSVHIAALRAGMEGDYRAARARYDAILARDPHDFVALWASQVIDYYLGEPHALRERTARVLAAWTPDEPGYHAVLAMHAFGLEETHNYGRAEDVGRRALSLDPRDPWAVHAVQHVFEMQGDLERGLEWLSEREPDWAPDLRIEEFELVVLTNAQ